MIPSDPLWSFISSFFSPLAAAADQLLAGWLGGPKEAWVDGRLAS